MKTTARLSLALICFAVLGGARGWAAEEERLAEPSAAKQADAEKLIKEVYKEDFAKRGPDERRALAKTMIEDAKTTKDVATQYELMVQAREIGIQLSDIDLALSACTEISKRFLLSGADLKLKVLATIKPSLKSTESFEQGGEAAMALTDEAIAADDFDTAQKALEQVIAFATSAKNIQLASDANVRKADVRSQGMAYFEYKVGLERLKADPSNPQAKYMVGSYLCLYRNEWDKGLALTAESSDASWAQVAKWDLAAPVAVPEMLKVADAWYDLGAARDSLRARIWMRAEFWYNLVLPNVEGLQKARVEKRLEAIALVKPSIMGSVSEATKKALPTSDEMRKVKDLCIAAKSGSAKNVNEMKAYVSTLTQRLGKDLLEGKEADFFARCRAELQLRRALDANGQGAFNGGSTLLAQFITYSAQLRTKEDFGGRLLALDHFNQTEKTLDDTAEATMVSSSVRQFITNNLTNFTTPKLKTELLAYLKTRGVPAKGLDQYAKTLPPAPKPTGAPAAGF